MGVNGEALQLHAVNISRISITSYARICISITSHVRIVSVLQKNVEGSYDKIIITIVPIYTGKNITRLLPLLLMLFIHNNTDGNKLMVSSDTMVILIY